MNELIPVLHVINECDDGSISRIVERIIRYSPEKTFRWYVCATRGFNGFEKTLADLGVEVENAIPGGPDGSSTAQTISKNIRRNHIRIVHSHTPRTIMEVWRAGQAARSRVDLSRPRHLATKHLLTTPQDRKMGLIYTLYDRLTLYPPDHLVTVSNRMAEQIKAQPGIPPSKVTAIPNSIPVDDFFRPDLREQHRKKMNFRPEMIVAGFTGRIQKVKNLDILIRALARLAPRYPHLHLAIAGEGDLQQALQELAQTLHVADLITWAGFSSDIPGFLSALDIYVQPSVNEGLSLSILEAMAAEKPVIATRVGSADEIIGDQNTGLIIPPNSVESIVGAMKMILDDPDRFHKLALRARAHVAEKYNVQTMVDNYANLYLHLNESRGQ